ncbi:MAG TPA: hypothetical protein VNH22_05885 [Blastocatellia bacterium]|nr:hypothetical protein [Blastocatellia bacterium]
MEAKLQELDQEEGRLRRALEELEDVVQKAPGSHRSGVPSREIVSAERDIQKIVLRLSELDRTRQEVTVSMTLKR